MPSNPWSARRKRQYQHIKDSLLESGKSEPLAEEIAARTVNKERAEHGETNDSTGASVNGVAASPNPKIEQAKRDIDAGMVDTDMRATPGLDARLRSKLVPGEGGKPPKPSK
jgi:hypothetical protein